MVLLQTINDKVSSKVHIKLIPPYSTVLIVPCSAAIIHIHNNV